MRSLQARLGAGLLGSLVLLFALQWLTVSLILRQVTEEQVASRLERDAEDLLATLAHDASGGPRLDSTRVESAYRRPFSGHYYVVLTASGALASRSLWDTSLAVAPLATGAKDVQRMTGPERQPLVVFIAGYNKDGQPVTIAVAEDLTEFNAAVWRFQLAYGAISAVALLLLIFTQRAILRGALRPLQAVRDEMQRLERGESQSLSTQVPAEIAPLVAEFNRLLLIWKERGRRSRESLGNLAHALKTQLALLTQAAEETRSQDDAITHARLATPIERIRALTERELKRARLAGAATPGTRVDVAAELDRLADAMRMIYADKAVAIEVHADADAEFKGDSEDFLELMGNLLDNAAKFCRQRVRVTVATHPALSVTVEDDGPGCADEKLDELTARGVRADERAPGAGLGLAIAQDVASGYGATLILGRSAALGGFLAQVTFPS